MRTPLTRHLARPVASLLLAVGCCSPFAPALPPEVESLAPGERLVVGATLAGGPEVYRLLVISPAAGTLETWRLQGGRGLTEAGAASFGFDEQVSWSADRRELVLRGNLGREAGSFVIDAQGAARAIGLPALPAEVAHASQPAVGPGDLVAVVGSVFPASGGAIAQLYVGTSGGSPVVLGEGMGLEDILYVRWAPDGGSLAFIGGSRPGGAYQRRAYLAELGPGSVRALSDAEVLIASAPHFTPDGAVVFAAARPAGGPALYRAARGASAEVAVALDDLPRAGTWGGDLVWSPDGRLGALGHGRENNDSPETLYVVDVEGGAVRDLLPPDLARARTGEATSAAAAHRPLGWSPDGLRLVFASDIAGHCRRLGSGAIGCANHLYEVSARGGVPERLHDQQLGGIRFAVWAR